MRTPRWVLAVVGDVFVTAGLLLLLFVGWQLWWTDVTANRDQSGTVQSLEHDFGATPAPAASPARTTPTPVVPLGKPFAIVRIPRLGPHYARPVLEGTGLEVLRKGLGHYPGTAMPGAVGNFALAGHRTTYGRPLHDVDRLRVGDRIVVETRATYSVYAVKRHVVVPPTAVDVLLPVPQRAGVRPTVGTLTLTACHPKYSAAQRYVVFAELVGTHPRSEGLPAGTLAAPGGTS